MNKSIELDSCENLDKLNEDSSFLNYIAEVKKHPLLSEEEENKIYDIFCKYNSLKDIIDLNNLLLEIKCRIHLSKDILIPDLIKNDYKKFLNRLNNNNYKLNINELINIKKIFEAIDKYNLLDADIKNLIKKIDLSIEYYKSRELLIVSNLRLVLSVARLYQNKGVELDDLIQEGNVGLIKAIEKYDINMGCKFSTYATWWIKQTILRKIYGYGKAIRIPENVLVPLNRYLFVIKKFSLQGNSSPSIEAIAKELGLKCETENDKKNLENKFSTYNMCLKSVVSLESPISRSDDIEPIYLMDTISSEYDLENDYDEYNLKKLIKNDIQNYINSESDSNKISVRKKRVFIICLRNGLPLTDYFSMNEIMHHINYLSNRINIGNINENNIKKAKKILYELKECYFTKTKENIIGYPRYSLSEIGIILGVTGEYVRQAESVFLRQAKNFAFSDLKDYVDQKKLIKN